jgi:hypothetical protein
VLKSKVTVLHNNGQLEMAMVMTQEEQLHFYSFSGQFWAHWPVEPNCDANRCYSWMAGETWECWYIAANMQISICLASRPK